MWWTADVAGARQVLVVDDEPDIREMLTMWLRDDPRCSSVLQAGDLDSAVEIAERDAPDALLLDFYLGNRVSAEGLPRIRAACPAALIIIYTASPEAARAAGVLEDGADLLVEKGRTHVDEVVELLLTAGARGSQSPPRRAAGEEAS